MKYQGKTISDLRKAVIGITIGLAGLVGGCDPDFSGVNIAPDISWETPKKSNPYEDGSKLHKASVMHNNMSQEEKQKYLEMFEKNPEKYSDDLKHYPSWKKEEKLKDWEKERAALIRELYH